MNILKCYKNNTDMNLAISKYREIIEETKQMRKYAMYDYVVAILSLFENIRYKKMLKRYLIQEPKRIIYFDYILTLCLGLINSGRPDEVIAYYDNHLIISENYIATISPLFDSNYRYFENAKNEFDKLNDEADIYITLPLLFDEKAYVSCIASIELIDSEIEWYNDDHHVNEFRINSDFISIIPELCKFLSEYKDDFNEEVAEYLYK